MIHQIHLKRLKKRIIINILLITKIILITHFPIRLSAQNTFKDFYSLGETQMKNEKYSLAVKSFTSALKLKQNDSKTLCKRGICYQNLEKYDLAIKDFLGVEKQKRLKKSSAQLDTIIYGWGKILMLEIIIKKL